MRVLPHHLVGSAPWNAFVDNCDECWFWHRRDYQDALSTWPGRRDVGFAVLDGDDVVGVVPLHLVSTRQLRWLPLRRLESAGGPGVRADLGGGARRSVHAAAMGEIRRLVDVLDVHQTDVALPPLSPARRGAACPRVNPLVELGFDNRLTQTWVVDLRGGADAVWAAMAGRARTAVRKAEREGVSVRVALQPGDCDAYYELHRTTYARTGVPPHPIDYFRAMWEQVVPAGLARIWFAELDGRVIAAQSFSWYKRAALYWTGAADGDGLRTGANNLLQWTAMTAMIAEGLEWYETGEAFPGATDPKQRALSDFKAAMGGELYPFYRGTMDHRKPLLRAADALRESVS